MESGTGRETDMEKCDPSGYQGVCTGKLLLVTILKRNGKAWIHMETEPEICRFKGSGDGTVHPATVSWKKLFRRGDPWTDLTAKSKTHLSKDGADPSKEETDRDTGIILFLSISDGSTAKKTEKKSVCHQRGYPETGSED